MRLATIIPPTVDSSPFPKASELYQKALGSLSFPANARVDVRAAVSSAIADTKSAISLLEPIAKLDDMFAGRNAKASIEAATTGVSALSSALATLEAPGASMPQIPVSTLLGVATTKIAAADDALGWE